MDHARKDNVPGTSVLPIFPECFPKARTDRKSSYSWQYIDKSVKNGVLENLDDHRVGEPARTVRAVGSVNSMPKKSTRTPFTAEDDRILTEWVTGYGARGGYVLGNKIYEQLAAEVWFSEDPKALQQFADVEGAEPSTYFAVMERQMGKISTTQAAYTSSRECTTYPSNRTGSSLQHTSSGSFAAST